MSTEVLDGEVAALLRSGDHRYTNGRRRVIAALRRADGPVTIPQILELDPDLAQSSVYRNLAILVEVGAVSRIVTHEDHAHFELAEVLTDHHHHHLICNNCGLVSDFELAPEIEQTLDRGLRRTGRSAQFRIEAHRLDLIGTCATCP